MEDPIWRLPPAARVRHHRNLVLCAGLPRKRECYFIANRDHHGGRFALTALSPRPDRGISAFLFVRPGETVRAIWTGKRWIITRRPRRQ